VILEGDEYDTAFFDKRSKFLHYLPTTLIINNIEFDHADIFSSLEEIKLSFKRCTLLVPQNGIIIANGEDKNVKDVTLRSIALIETFGLTDDCDWQARNIRYLKDSTEFDLYFKGILQTGIEVNLLGEFNVRNSLAVISAARKHGVSYSNIQQAFRSFKNVKRRLELKGEYNGIKVYDDFAHHPTAIAGTLKAIRAKYPDNRIIAIFEPRSNTTRRNIFQKELAECFNEADVVFISQIARLNLLKENERLDPEKVMSDIRAKGKDAYYLENAEKISDKVRDIVRPNDVIIVMSNGAFGGIHELLRDKLNKRA
jgi:UDP-N-acetylmuramate: L-alanyl-gamma-D-glutamyl-meso-diaminopimelate ligase